jgi:cobalt/nickel transport system permease protein
MSRDTCEEGFAALVRSRGLHPPRDRFLDRGLRRLARFFAGGLLREETAARAHVLRAVDPRARLVAVLIYLVSVSLAASLPVLLAHAVIPIAALALARIHLREVLAAGLLLAAGFSLLMAGPATLNLIRPGEVIVPLLALPDPWWLGPAPFPVVVGITREGLLGAGTFLVRVLASVAMVLWLTLSTRWVDLLRALRGLGLPPLVIQVAGMAVRYVHALLRQSEEVHLGKRSRTVCRRRLAADQSWVGSRIGMTWVRGLHLMQEVGDAMTARGFTGDLRAPAGARLAYADWIFLAAVVLACLGTRLV